jgi:hypothetical protein
LERDNGALSALTDRAGKRKKKNISFFFSQPILLSCPFRRGKGQPTSSRILALELVLAPAEYKKKLPSLYSICAASTVFLKTSSSLSRAMLLSPDKPLQAVASTAQLLPAFLLYAVGFQ